MLSRLLPVEALRKSLYNAYLAQGGIKQYSSRSYKGKAVLGKGCSSTAVPFLVLSLCNLCILSAFSQAEIE